MADIVEEGSDPILGPEELAGDQVVAAYDRFRATEIDQNVTVLDALNFADHDLADSVLELVVLTLPLGLAHALHDDLLGALRRDAAEVDRRQRVEDVVTDLGCRVAHLRVLEPDLARVVLDRVGDLQLTVEPMLPGSAIDLGHDLVLGAIGPTCGSLIGLLHGLEHFVDRDALLLCHRLDNAQYSPRDPGSSSCPSSTFLAYNLSPAHLPAERAAPVTG